MDQYILAKILMEIYKGEELKYLMIKYKMDYLKMDNLFMVYGFYKII